MRGQFRLGMIVVGTLAAAIAVGQGRPSPDQAAVNFRSSLMTVVQGTMQPLALMGRDRAPYDAAVVTKNAERLVTLTGMIPDAFERDTSAASIQTESNPTLWKEKQEFVRLANESRTRAEALLAAAKGGDQAKTKAAINALGSSCSGCHDKYRVENR